MLYLYIHSNDLLYTSFFVVTVVKYKGQHKHMSHFFLDSSLPNQWFVDFNQLVCILPS